MAYSEVSVDGIGKVRVFRRKGLKNIRITLEHDGRVRLSLPWYVPKSAGIRYLLAKKTWIAKHRKPVFEGWTDGQRLTDSHVLRLYDVKSSKTKTTRASSALNIYLPSHYAPTKKQDTIKKYVAGFLKSVAEKELPERLERLARENNFKYSGVRFKKMKSRWGSCSSAKIISLNIILLTMPTELLEYVMIHELVHTKHLHHGKEFWQAVEAILPDYKALRKQIRQFNPAGFF